MFSRVNRERQRSEMRMEGGKWNLPLIPKIEITHKHLTYTHTLPHSTPRTTATRIIQGGSKISCQVLAPISIV